MRRNNKIKKSSKTKRVRVRLSYNMNFKNSKNIYFVITYTCGPICK